MYEPEQNSSHCSLAVLTTVLKISKKILFVLANEKYLLNEAALFSWARQHLDIFSFNCLTW